MLPLHRNSSPCCFLPCMFDQPLTCVIFTRAAEFPFDLYCLCYKYLCQSLRFPCAAASLLHTPYVRFLSITYEHTHTPTRSLRIFSFQSSFFLDLYCTFNIPLKHEILNVNNSHAISLHVSVGIAICLALRGKNEAGTGDFLVILLKKSLRI